MSTFSISIKSLVTCFAYHKTIKLDEWQEICGFMKKQAHDNLGAPIQMVDVLSDAFERRVMKN